MEHPNPPSDAKRPLRIAALVSGGGRTVLNLCDCIDRSELHAEIVVVISSSPTAPAIDRCRQRGLSVRVVDRASVADASFHQQIAGVLREARAELVCMAGFLSLWRIPDDFAGRVINIHPALLPDFGGKGFYGDRVHQAVLASGATESGCTVHFADNQYDHGPIILQRRVPVLPDDTPQHLAARVFEQERIAYPRVIEKFARGKLPLPGDCRH